MAFRTYCRASATIFAIVSVAHLTRLLSGWSVQVEDTFIPLLFSLLGCLVTGAMAFWGFRQSRSAE